MSANKFLEDKWRKAFRFMDIDKDGYWTEKDFETIAVYISERTEQTDGEQKKKTWQEWVKWIEIMLRYTSSEKLDEAGFMESMREMYKDLESTTAHNRATYSTLFDDLDLDKDGKISYEELAIYYGGYGIKDEVFIKSICEKLDTDKDGYIEREELIAAARKYWLSPDESDGHAHAFIYDSPN